MYVCMYVPPCGWGRATYLVRLKLLKLVWILCVELRTSNDGTYQACSPAEALHPSQGRSSNCAHRTCNTCVWFIASWNVRTLLDVEGSVETARQSCDVSVAWGSPVHEVVQEQRRIGSAQMCTVQARELVESAPCATCCP